jgi:hypothetical protein
MSNMEPRSHYQDALLGNERIIPICLLKFSVEEIRISG